MNAVIALVVANVIWGAAPPIFKLSLQGIPPFTLAFIRFFGAGLIFLPFALRYTKKISIEDWRDIIVGAFFGVVINVGFFFVGLEFAPSINMHIIGSVGPIILYMFSIYWLKEKPHEHIVFGMGVALLGILTIILAPLLEQDQSESLFSSHAIVLVGNILYIFSTLGIVLHTLIYKRILKRIPAVTATSYGFLISSLFFLPYVVYELNSWSFDKLTVNGALGIVYGVFFSSALAYFLYNYGVSHMQAQKVGVFSYIAPIVAVIVAIPLVHEYPDIYFLFGSILVFVGIYISEHKMRIHKLEFITTAENKQRPVVKVDKIQGKS